MLKHDLYFITSMLENFGFTPPTDWCNKRNLPYLYNQIILLPGFKL